MEVKCKLAQIEDNTGNFEEAPGERGTGFYGMKRGSAASCSFAAANKLAFVDDSNKSSF